MTAEADQLVLDFLGRVADLAQGRMAPISRAQLVERLRRDIQEKVEERGASRASEVRQILLGMGTAEALVTVEANKDPLYGARQRAQQRGRASVFSPEVDPAVAALVTPDSLLNPPPERFPVSTSSGEGLAGPELPLDPDPFGAGVGEWQSSEIGDTLTMPPVGSGPQVPMEGAGPSAPVGAMTPAMRPPSLRIRGLRGVGQTAAQNHSQAFLSIAVLAVGAAMNAASSSPYAIVVVAFGYLLAMTSYSYSPGEKRFAMMGVPTAALMFYAFGLFLARGRSTGHTEPADVSSTWAATKDWVATVPTMLGLLAALYLSWRLARSVAKAG